MINIMEMTLQDYEIIKDNLIEKFDDFWNKNLLKDEIINPTRKYFTLKDDNIIKGFIGILLNGKDAEIMNIVVEKNSRNNGFGNLLLKASIEYLRKNNFEKILLEVNEKNVFAIKLYEKNGFKKTGLRRKYYNNTDNAILMEKDFDI